MTEEMPNPFDAGGETQPLGSTEMPPVAGSPPRITRNMLPASLASLAHGQELNPHPTNPTVEEQDAEMVIGLFDPASFGSALRERKFSNAETATTLVDIIRTAGTKERLAAINTMHKLTKDMLKMSGAVQTEKAHAVQVEADGSKKELVVSQTRLQSRITGQRPTITTDGKGVTITPPLTQEQIKDANIIHPDTATSSRHATTQETSEEESYEEEDQEEICEDDSFEGDGDDT